MDRDLSTILVVSEDLTSFLDQRIRAEIGAHNRFEEVHSRSKRSHVGTGRMMSDCEDREWERSDNKLSD